MNWFTGSASVGGYFGHRQERREQIMRLQSRIVMRGSECILVHIFRPVEIKADGDSRGTFPIAPPRLQPAEHEGHSGSGGVHWS